MYHLTQTKQTNTYFPSKGSFQHATVTINKCTDIAHSEVSRWSMNTNTHLPCERFCCYFKREQMQPQLKCAKYGTDKHFHRKQTMLLYNEVKKCV